MTSAGGETVSVQRHRAQHCEGFPHKAATFREFVGHLASLRAEELHGLNLHFMPQAFFCGFVIPHTAAAAASAASGGTDEPLLLAQGTLSRFHHVLRLSSPTYEVEASAVLAALGIAPSVTRELLMLRDAHQTGATAQVRELYTRATARAARAVYDIDYRTFQLPEPAWLEEVRGGDIDGAATHNKQVDTRTRAGISTFLIKSAILKPSSRSSSAGAENGRELGGWRWGRSAKAKSKH